MAVPGAILPPCKRVPVCDFDYKIRRDEQKHFYERRDYESVEDISLSWAISQKPTTKKLTQQRANSLNQLVTKAAYSLEHEGACQPCKGAGEAIDLAVNCWQGWNMTDNLCRTQLAKSPPSPYWHISRGGGGGGVVNLVRQSIRAGLGVWLIAVPEPAFGHASERGYLGNWIILRV